MTSKRNISPAIRDALVSMLLVWSISAGTGYVTYDSAGEGLKREVQGNLLSIAKGAAQLIDGDLHREIAKPEDKGSETYERVRAPFFKLLKANDNIAFIYTAVMQEGKVYFVVDAQIPKPGAKSETSDVMEEYPDATETMRQALSEKKALVEDEAYTDEYGTFLSAYAPFYDAQGNYIGVIGADIRLTDYLNRLSSIRLALTIGLVVAALASLTVGWLVYYFRKKGLLSEEAARRQQAEMLALEAAQESERRSQKEEAERRSREQLRQMADRFEASVKSVVEEVKQSVASLRSGADGVKSIAENTQGLVRQATAASASADRTAAQAASAVEQLMSSIQEISRETVKSNEVAKLAAEKSGVAKRYIDTLNEKSSHVGEIVGMITAIAGQINLLALNATIESARAGEAGKGFAVVAGEVKNLANQVAKATEEVTKQISEMQNATKVSVESVVDVIGIIENVSVGAAAIAGSVSQQSEATRDIARNIEQTSAGVREINDGMQPVQGGADQTIDTAKRVVEAIVALDRLSTVLEQRADEFLSSVRSA